MSKYSCIIIEDEPLAAEVLADYVKQVPFLELKGICSDAIFAIEVLQKQKIDLIFLDIHLPKIKGFDFIEALNHPPHIIITSAYKEYALKGYEANVLDYLLKPIRFTRFLMAVNKLNNLIPSNSGHSFPAGSIERAHLFFNVNKKKIKVFLDEILYIESLKEYIRIFTKDKTILTKYQLSQVKEILSNNNFVRIHRSFVVAKDKIEAFTATDVEISGKQIPIGRSYKETVLQVLEPGN
jgi:DNA-binding LytR/AlgR family response regulator